MWFYLRGKLRVLKESNFAVKLLIADPNPADLQFLEETFKKSGFDVFCCTSGEELFRVARNQQPNIIVLEINMPDKDGIEICTELRQLQELNQCIIVFYTHRNEDYSQIAAFNAGADDYIIKPVKANVLKSRIAALLKRFVSNGNIYSDKIQTGIQIDREKYIVFKDGEEVVLPRKEFELLSLLNTSPRKVFTREEISKAVWGYDTQAHNRTIDVHVRKLRQKLGPGYIKTVKGVGYSILP